MSENIENILTLTQKLTVVEQWQVVKEILDWLQKETLLSKLEELSKTNGILDDLNSQQLKQLAIALEENESGKTISHSQVKENVKKWLSR